MNLKNYGLKDEICRYWTIRSETFDEAPGHGMRSDAEFRAWVDVMRCHLGDEWHRNALELGCGTGQMTAVLLSLGLQVTAVDLCQAMIDRAAAKHRGAAGRVAFRLGDAENTMAADASFDLVVSRHLVWTLLDPEAAFADWYRALRPGGRVVIVDGDWVNAPKRIGARIAGHVSRWIDRFSGTEPRYDAAAHDAIISRVYFKDGLRVERVREMLGNVGFGDFSGDALTGVLTAQRRDRCFSDRLKHYLWHDLYFVISATKPQ